jgi:hypothetical protein
MDIDQRNQNLSARLSTTTDPALRENLQKELQELLNQKFSKKERVLKRDNKGRFTRSGLVCPTASLPNKLVILIFV